MAESTLASYSDLRSVYWQRLPILFKGRRLIIRSLCNDRMICRDETIGEGFEGLVYIEGPEALKGVICEGSATDPKAERVKDLSRIIIDMTVREAELEMELVSIRERRSAMGLELSLLDSERYRDTPLFKYLKEMAI